jgi:hypothetical protein
VNDLRGQYLIARELQNLLYKYFRSFEPVMQQTVLVPSGLLNYDNIFGLFYTIIIPDEAEKFFTFRDIHRVGGFVDIAVLREHALSKESRIIRPSFRRVEKP